MKNLLFACCLVLFTGISISAQKPNLTADELAHILGITVWRVPSVQNQDWEWRLQVIDATEQKITDKPPSPKELNYSKMALIALRFTESEMFEVTLSQSFGQSRFKLKIEPCSEKEKKAGDCPEALGSNITFYPEPRFFADGSGIVLGEVGFMINSQGKPKKLIILKPYQFRRSFN